MVGKQEPWFKPRADEDADEELINWLGGGGGGKPPAKQGGGCWRVAIPAVAVAIGLLLALLA